MTVTGGCKETVPSHPCAMRLRKDGTPGRCGLELERVSAEDAVEAEGSAGVAELADVVGLMRG